MQKNLFLLRDGKDHIIQNTFYATLLSNILSSLTTYAGALIDGVVIGQFLGVNATAAFGVISPIIVVFALFGAVVASGARNHFTHLVGSGCVEEAQGVFTLSVVLSVSFATALMGFVLLFSGPVTAVLGATGSAAGVFEEARRYLIGIAIGLPAMNAVRILNAYMAIDNHRNLQVLSSIAMTVTDVVLDLLAATVFHGGTFEMGLATSLSYYAALLVLLTHFRRRERLLRFSLSTIRWKDTAGIIGKGLPMGVARVSNTLRSVFMNRLLAAMATAGAIAAYSVHRQADSLLNSFTLGLGNTVITLTGILFSEQNSTMLRRLLRTSGRAVATVVLAASALFYVLSPQFAALFIRNDPQALRYAVTAARAYALGMPLYGLNEVYVKYLEGIGRTRAAAVLTFLRECGFLVLSASVLLPVCGPDAIWYAFPAAQVLHLGALFVLNRACTQKMGLQGSSLADRVMMLPADFDVPTEDRIERSVGSDEEVVMLSQAAWRFCEDHGCDYERKYAISLAVEEMAMNTLLTGVRPGRHNRISMRILKKGEEYILRIRDDCLIFDPVRQLKLYDEKVPAHHMGLRMAIGLAKEVRYTTLLRLNNLVLRV